MDRRGSGSVPVCGTRSLGPPQLAAAGLFASPRISSARGARGPTTKAIQNHVLDDLLRSMAIALASGIDPIETMTKSQKPMAISNATRRRYHRRGARAFPRQNVRLGFVHCG